MYLITGGNGLLGRTLIDQLLDAGNKVRAATRHPATAGLPAGVEVVAGDPSEPETLRAALVGRHRVVPNCV
ncbi:SDR family oxidoreductase [Nonomuraea turcica]|uniref:SDR family oxidoreductase n=1 Tax=Nonomuraea sp. G32 TaxID=3067274 RepID=UPI00273BA04E|nr:NAD(P)H-binding protein [Nonomuraea sp. G32]MDP4511051.1 NAD(P)H-binding protein [Nonomuraea sp. G32]